jgi:ABC-type antimicrobial peptide transport system permease subunit
MTQFLRHFKTKPLQMLLTIVQIVLGSFAMTFALSAYFTPEDTREIDRFYLRAGDRGENTWTTYNVFEEKDLPDILALTDAVDDIAIYDASGAPLTPEVSYNGQKVTFALTATVSANYFNIVNVGIISGSVFSSAEAAREEAVVVLSQNSAKTIFGDVDPIGKELSVSVQMMDFDTTDNVEPRSPTLTYRVIGIFDDVVGRTLYGRPGIYFPVWVAPPSTIPNMVGFSSTGLVVQAKSGQSEAAREQMLAAVRLTYKHNSMVAMQPKGRDFFTDNSREVDGIQSSVNPIFIILGLFGIIALIISSIGMFSNTFVDITRRTHEIGINRALGATSNHIGRMFSLEAAFLALVGSILGAALAGILMPVLIKPLEQSFLYGTQRVAWQPLAALIVIAVAVLLGALLAFVPALRAGRMKPIEALRNV